MPGVFRNIDPPPPHHPASVYLPPPAFGARGYTLTGWRGRGVNSSGRRQTLLGTLYKYFVGHPLNSRGFPHVLLQKDLLWVLSEESFTRKIYLIHCSDSDTLKEWLNSILSLRNISMKLMKMYRSEVLSIKIHTVLHLGISEHATCRKYVSCDLQGVKI